MKKCKEILIKNIPGFILLFVIFSLSILLIKPEGKFAQKVLAKQVAPPGTVTCASQGGGCGTSCNTVTDIDITPIPFPDCVTLGIKDVIHCCVPRSPAQKPPGGVGGAICKKQGGVCSFNLPTVQVPPPSTSWVLATSVPGLIDDCGGNPSLFCYVPKPVSNPGFTCAGSCYDSTKYPSCSAAGSTWVGATGTCPGSQICCIQSTQRSGGTPPLNNDACAPNKDINTGASCGDGFYCGQTCGTTGFSDSLYHCVGGKEVVGRVDHCGCTQCKIGPDVCTTGANNGSPIPNASCGFSSGGFSGACENQGGVCVARGSNCPTTNVPDPNNPLTSVPAVDSPYTCVDFITGASTGKKCCAAPSAIGSNGSVGYTNPTACHDTQSAGVCFTQKCPTGTKTIDTGKNMTAGDNVSYCGSHPPPDAKPNDPLVCCVYDPNVPVSPNGSSPLCKSKDKQGVCIPGTDCSNAPNAVGIVDTNNNECGNGNSCCVPKQTCKNKQGVCIPGTDCSNAPNAVGIVDTNNNECGNGNSCCVLSVNVVNPNPTTNVCNQDPVPPACYNYRCSCVNPGASYPYNKFQCTDGNVGTCPASQVCNDNPNTHNFISCGDPGQTNPVCSCVKPGTTVDTSVSFPNNNDDDAGAYYCTKPANVKNHCKNGYYCTGIGIDSANICAPTTCTQDNNNNQVVGECRDTCNKDEHTATNPGVACSSGSCCIPNLGSSQQNKVTCTCDYPNASPLHNSYHCSDNTSASCAGNTICSSNTSFDKGSIQQVCKTPDTTKCGCDNPGDPSNGNYHCTDNPDQQNSCRKYESCTSISASPSTICISQTCRAGNRIGICRRSSVGCLSTEEVIVPNTTSSSDTSCLSDLNDSAVCCSKTP